MARKPTKPRRPRKDDIKAAAERAEKRSKGEPIVTAPLPITPKITKTPEDGPRIGRPPKYKPEFAAVAKALCARGATDAELAAEFGVTTVTIWRWTSKFEAFCNALKVEKGAYDDRIERSLAQRAMGYTYNTEKLFHNRGRVVRAEVVEHVPADVGAAKLWLTNRRRDKWKDIQSHEHGNLGDFDEMSDAELGEFIAAETADMQINGKPVKAGGTRH